MDASSRSIKHPGVSSCPPTCGSHSWRHRAFVIWTFWSSDGTLKEGGDLQPAINHLNAARGLASSDPGRAVGLCRLVIEALEAVAKEHGYGSVAEHLTACTDELRGEHYGRIIASAKQLAALNHHHFGQDSTFTRAEALALVRVSEALVLMLGELSPRLITESGEDGENP